MSRDLWQVALQALHLLQGSMWSSKVHWVETYFHNLFKRKVLSSSHRSPSPAHCNPEFLLYSSNFSSAWFTYLFWPLHMFSFPIFHFQQWGLFLSYPTFILLLLPSLPMLTVFSPIAENDAKVNKGSFITFDLPSLRTLSKNPKFFQALNGWLCQLWQSVKTNDGFQLTTKRRKIKPKTIYSSVSTLTTY